MHAVKNIFIYFGVFFTLFLMSFDVWSVGIGSQGAGETMNPDMDFAEPSNRLEMGLILVFSFVVCWWAALTDKFQFRKSILWQFFFFMIAPGLLAVSLARFFLK